MLPCFPGAIICAGGEPRHACQTPQNQAGFFFAQADFISIDASHRNAAKPLSAFKCSDTNAAATRARVSGDFLPLPCRNFKLVGVCNG